MIISRGRRYIFVHAPKTGGTAMALALEARAMKDDILIGDTPKALRRQQRIARLKTAGRLWKHSTLADVEGLITRQEMSALFVFTLLRNPWDRLVSYYFWLQTQSFQHPAVTYSKTLNFSDFLRAPGLLDAFRNQPSRCFTSDSSGTNHVDLVVRLEHLETDLAALWRHLNFDLSLQRVNASRRPLDYRTLYQPADVALVGEACAEDIVLGRYQFE